jgi:hypothetical protein
MTMTAPEAGVTRRDPARARVALVVVLALAVALAAALWVRDHRRDQEWEHGDDGVRAQARIEARSLAGFGDALAAAGVRPVLGMSVAGQMLVVQVSWTDTPATDGRYAFILLDRRVSPPSPLRAYGVWADDDEGGSEWGSAYETLAEHYPWLARTASRHTAQGWTNDTEALGVDATAAGDGTLAYWLAKDDVQTRRPDRDLLLAMVFSDADGEVQWARKVAFEPGA